VEREQIFATLAAERHELVGILRGLDDDAFATPSLCAGWTVQVVVGHLVAAAQLPVRALLRAALRHRGSIHAANDELARRMAAARTPEQLVAALAEVAEQRTDPPIVGPHGPLVDILVHGGDIRLPLGLRWTAEADGPPVPAVEDALDFLTGRNSFVPRRVRRGLALQPVDSARRWGSGAPVVGTAFDVMMAVSGRTATLDRLSGEGAELLRGRLAA
jgi:uncharacterized protein (TIGR03083 family)